MGSDEGGTPQFRIVKFPNEGNSVAIVHCSWIRDGKCFWPNERSPRQLQQITMRGVKPQSTWTAHECIEVFSFESYDAARRKLSQAEETSDLCSESDLGRGRRKKRRKACSDAEVDCIQLGVYTHEASSSSEDLYTPPKPPTPPTLRRSAYFVAPNHAQLHSTPLQVNNSAAKASAFLGVHSSHESPGTFTPLGPRPTPVSSYDHNILQGGVYEELQGSSSVMTLSTGPTSQVSEPPLRHVTTARSSSALPDHGFSEQGASTTSTTMVVPSRTPPHEACISQHGFCQEVLKLLHTLKLTLQSHGEQLLLILQRLSSQEQAPAQSLDDCIDEPFRTIEDFMVFEENLRKDAKKREQLKLYMKFIGGSDIGDRTMRILSRLLLPAVGKEFSLQGTRWKRKFADLQTWKLMCGCLAPESLERAAKEGTLKEVEKAVQSWLRHAPESYKRQQKQRTEKSNTSGQPTVQ